MLHRRQVGDTLTYHGAKIRALHMGPDLLCAVDDVELSGFYLNVEAAHTAGRAYVDAERKALDDKRKKENR